MRYFIRVKFNKILIWIFEKKIITAKKKMNQHKKEGNTVICSAYTNLIKTYEDTILYLKVDM